MENKNKIITKPELLIDVSDLKTLYALTKYAYPDTSFSDWCDESKKSYMSYFENKQLFSVLKYTYSEFVNAQILAIT